MGITRIFRYHWVDLPIYVYILTCIVALSCAKECIYLTDTKTIMYSCAYDCCGSRYQQYCCEKDDYGTATIVFGAVLGGFVALVAMVTCTVCIMKAYNHKKMRTGNVDGRASDIPQSCTLHHNVNHLFTPASITLPPPYLEKPPPYIISVVDTNPTTEDVQLPGPSIDARHSDSIPLTQQLGQSTYSRQRPQSAVSLPPPYAEAAPITAEPPRDTSFTNHDHIRY